MWIMTPFGFFSIVCARDTQNNPHPTLRMIRARNRDHLAALRKHYPVLGPIQTNRDTDYPYRIFAAADVVGSVVASITDNIDYHNFKSEAKLVSPDDHAYHQFLGRVWANGLDMTPPSMRADLEGTFELGDMDRILPDRDDGQLPPVTTPPVHIGFKCNGDIRYPLTQAGKTAARRVRAKKKRRAKKK